MPRYTANYALEPRVYVECVKCATSEGDQIHHGGSHGEWFDAEDGLSDAVAEHFRSTEDGPPTDEAVEAETFPCGGAELRVTDTEDFEGVKINTVEEAEGVGTALREHDKARVLVALMDHLGYGPDDIDQAVSYYEENYQGSSRGGESGDAEWAQELAESIHNASELGTLANYIDWNRYAEDLLSSDFFSVEVGTETHYFRNG
jgi:antirestriction protein